jgi:hypothetical protein
MRCPADAELSRLYDGGVAAPRAEEVRAHLRECPACRECLRGFERLEAALAGRAPTVDCLTPEELAEIEDGVADAETASRAQAHAVSCEHCREALQWRPPPVVSVGADRAATTLRLLAADGAPIRALEAAGDDCLARVTFLGINEATRLREEVALSLPLSATGEIAQPLEFAAGRAAVRCELLNCRAGGETVFEGTARLGRGANVISLGPPSSGPADNYEGFVHVVGDRGYANTVDLGAKVLATPNDYFGALLRALDRDRNLEREIDRFEKTSVNLFDSVRVYSDDRVFLDDDFDRYRAGETEVLGLESIWGGRIGLVADAAEMAWSPPNVWLSEAYPNANRADGVRITPADLPSGRLTFEAAVYVSDPAKGALVGLIHRHALPPDIEEVYASEPALICFRDNWVYVCRWGARPGQPLPPDFQGLARFQEKRWHLLKADVDLQARCLDVWLDGALIGPAVPMYDDYLMGTDFNFFTLSGANFVLQQQSARA